MTTRDVLFAPSGCSRRRRGLMAVPTRQVVHAALWLVTALGALAGCYLVLGAEVVALVQLLVYVGAVVVLVLFALMLTRAPIGRPHDVDSSWPQRFAAAAAGVAVTRPARHRAGAGGQGRAVVVDSERAAAQPLARSLFGAWALPFELLSLLLLAALVAALGGCPASRTVGGDPPRPAGAAGGRARRHGGLRRPGPAQRGAGAGRRRAAAELGGPACSWRSTRRYGDALHGGQVLTVFIITVAAAEVGVALAVVLLLFRRRRDVDLRAARDLAERADTQPVDVA